MNRLRLSSLLAAKSWPFSAAFSLVLARSRSTKENGSGRVGPRGLWGDCGLAILDRGSLLEEEATPKSLWSRLLFVGVGSAEADRREERDPVSKLNGWVRVTPIC